ncbi:hypothetical protein [Streptomyces purpureus]|uniref:Uncharacterized protein n=1 Tax=Streptomyces purpureus TaxID=1951 RepID=A0A918GXS2_9ACTN|nr:hypothetical protein [Streptomyces purpureus]GGT13063.1 hypothetical protein GCM10014713_01940 [Streptomyces purpureus]
MSNAGAGAPTAPEQVADGRTVQLLGLDLQFTIHEEISVPLPSPGAAAVEKPFVLKEGVECRVVIRFEVTGPSVTGLRVLDVREMEGAEISRREVHLGDFRQGGPYELALPPERIPSGRRAQGRYDVHASLLDADDRVLDVRDYCFEVDRDWG